MAAGAWGWTHHSRGGAGAAVPEVAVRRSGARGASQLTRPRATVVARPLMKQPEEKKAARRAAVEEVARMGKRSELGPARKGEAGRTRR